MPAAADSFNSSISSTPSAVNAKTSELQPHLISRESLVRRHVSCLNGVLDCCSIFYSEDATTGRRDFIDVELSRSVFWQSVNAAVFWRQNLQYAIDKRHAHTRSNANAHSHSQSHSHSSNAPNDLIDVELQEFVVSWLIEACHKQMEFSVPHHTIEDFAQQIADEYKLTTEDRKQMTLYLDSMTLVKQQLAHSQR